MVFFPTWLRHIPYRRKILAIALLTLVIPLEVFVIGDFYGGGFQTPLFRYQDTIFGSFIVLVSRDIWSVLTGFATGVYALSLSLWVIAAGILLANVVLLCLGTKDFASKMITGGKLVMISGLLFLSSIVLQYGPLFHNPMGISIPLGIPLLLLIGFWMYSEGVKNIKSGPSGD
jgi:hypothetical protein